MSPLNGVHVIGAGGHARVIISTLRACGRPIEAVYDDNHELWGETLLGVKIRGPLSELPDQCSPALIGVGDARMRKSIVNRIKADWITLVHPQAWVDPTVKIGKGTVVFAGAVVQPSTHIGCQAIINTGATVDHDCRIEDYVHIAPGSNLCGNVHVANGAWVGAGSVIIENTNLGPWSYTGAGSVVIQDLESYDLAVGSPAKVIRKLEG